MKSIVIGSKQLDQEHQEVSRLAAKMQRGYFKGKMLAPKLHDELPEITPAPLRKRKKQHHLSITDKIDVVYAVLVDHEKQADVA